EHDGFPETAIEEVQLLAHLPLLVGRRTDDEIGRERAADVFDSGANCRPEAIDLCTFLHFRRQHDGPASHPTPALIAPCVVRNKSCRMLVTTMHASDIAEIDRRTVCRLCEHDLVDVGERPEFTRLLEGQLASFGIDGPRGHRGVATLQDYPDCGWNDPEGCQTVLRVPGFNLLLNHAD